LVQVAVAPHLSAERPDAAQHSQSSHDVQSHSGQSDGQQQHPPASAIGAPASAVAAVPDSPMNIMTSTIAAMARAA
jgi:hypothetical protein